MGEIFEYIEQFVIDELKRFNAGRRSDKGIYYVLLPNSKTAYYTLWFYNPNAVHHPSVYLANLDMNAMGSVSKAMKIISNSYAQLTVTNQLDSTSGNGDDIIMFGKYRGYHLYQIYTIDPRYISWIADKYEARVKSEQRFKEMAVTYSQVHLDLNTPRIYKVPISQHIGTPGEKLTGLQLTITRVRIEDDPYKTRVVQGTPYFYVDQLLTAADQAGNLFFFSVKAKGRSLASDTLSNSDYAYKAGDVLDIASAKVLKHIVSRTIKYTKLGYLKIKTFK